MPRLVHDGPLARARDRRASGMPSSLKDMSRELVTRTSIENGFAASIRGGCAGIPWGFPDHRPNSRLRSDDLPSKRS
jgi:hypothetical protein